jgi:hypothetical protein
MTQALNIHQYGDLGRRDKQTKSVRQLEKGLAAFSQSLATITDSSRALTTILTYFKTAEERLMVPTVEEVVLPESESGAEVVVAIQLALEKMKIRRPDLSAANNQKVTELVSEINSMLEIIKEWAAGKNGDISALKFVEFRRGVGEQDIYSDLGACVITPFSEVK